MKRYYIITLTAILTTFWGCNNDHREFPPVRKLNAFRETAFLPTLEHEISNNANAIYSATLLFAWDEIRKKIVQPIDIDNSLSDLLVLNNSKSFIKVLHTNEYKASGEVEGEIIRARAEFSKSLTFEFKLTSFTDQLTFDGQKVASFGQVGHNYHTVEIIQILYYKNDNNFIIRLSPKDKEHEIILFKSEDTHESMSKILPLVAKKIEIGKKEKQSDKTSWRYYLMDDDEVVIPKFKFNIENNYTSLEGKTFKAGIQAYLIEAAYQRTAFILDESGAEIESEAEIVATTEVEEEEIKPHPKKMKFDKPFFLMLKRIDSNNPYFGLWANNSELMVVEE